MITTSPKFHRRAAAVMSNRPQGTSTSEAENSNVAISALLTETEVSNVLRVSLATLRKWRVDNRGPRFIKIGPLVRYQLEDLREWLSSLPTGGIASQSPHSATGM
jgi:excisionase family DNA binding protein